MLTESQEARLAGEVTKIYAGAVDKIIINAARHFRDTQKTPALWEMKRRAETDDYAAETAAIIRKSLKGVPDAVRKAISESVGESLTDDGNEPETAIKRAQIKAYTDRVMDEESKKAEGVARTMLDSSVGEYLTHVGMAVRGMTQEQADKAKVILDTEESKAIDAKETQDEAITAALNKLAEAGVTGFIDRTGRHWTPEAYVSMDVTTQIHNAGVESEKVQSNIFRCSTHPRSRPTHYAYQGKYYSWDNTEGWFTDGNGDRHHYEPVSVTKYGTAGGLFGINCRHKPEPIVPGKTKPKEVEETDKRKDEKQYENEQWLRHLESEYRYFKRMLSVQKPSSDGYKYELMMVKRYESEIKAWADRYNLPRDTFREDM